MSIPPYVVAGLLALIVTYGIAHEMHWISRRLGAMTPPGGRHIHRRPMPRMGGLAIFAGILFALLVALPMDRPIQLVREARYVVLAVPYHPLAPPILGILLGVVAITALGLADDLRPMSGKVKFPLIYLAAGIPVLFGMTTNFIRDPLSHALVPLGIAGKIFTVVWLGSMAIAMNSIDGVDGLAAGIAAITGSTLFVVAVKRVDPTTMVLAAAVIGGSVGFLRHNFSPARIFMGDSGSMLLGFLLGAAAVQGLFKTVTALSLTIPLLALAIPILDTAYAILRRYRGRVSIFLADRGHFHHRLLDRGLSPRQVTVVLYLCSAVFALGGLVADGVNRTVAVTLLVITGVLLLTVVWRVGLFRFRPSPPPVQGASQR